MSWVSSLSKAEPISYMILIRCDNPKVLNIKSLNYPKIEKGIYIYVGSANLRNPMKRILRHFRKTKGLRWHIDYLTTSCTTFASILIRGLTEADTYGILEKLTQKRASAGELKVRPSIRRFGTSDNLRHKTHLFRVEGSQDPYAIITELLKVLSGTSSVSKVDLVLE